MAVQLTVNFLAVLIATVVTMVLKEGFVSEKLSRMICSRIVNTSHYLVALLVMSLIIGLWP